MASMGTGSVSGFKMMRAWGAIALVFFLALGVCASVASADPLSMTFTEGRANVGVQLSDDALFEAPDTAPFEAQIDGSGSITAGKLEVPDFVTHITEPIVADVTVEFEIGEIEGSFNQATGALTLKGEAGGTLTSEGRECIVSTEPPVLTLTTAGGTGGANPRFGAPFLSGLAGAGAIAGQWADMEATAVIPEDTGFCSDVEGQIDEQGGVWLEQEDIVSPPAPQLTRTDPASPNASGTPRIFGFEEEAGSTVSIYAGPSCTGTPVATGSAAELDSPGIAVAVAEGVTATFSATATDAAGNTSACSTSISYTRLKVTPPPPPVCIVPKLAGKTLKAAKRKIRAADCKVGKVHKPKRTKGGALVVKSSSPAAGASPANGKVNLRLGPKPKKGRY
jgi:PASTA domain-containing protein